MIEQLCEITVCRVFDAVGATTYYGALFALAAVAWLGLIVLAPRTMRRALAVVGVVGFTAWAALVLLVPAKP